MRRWVIFSAVGILGFVVQLGALTLLLGAGLHYIGATMLAVEAAVLHNYCWHTRSTWRERTGMRSSARLWRFHLLNGLLSLLGNILAMWLLVGLSGLPPISANLIAAGACALANFVVSDRFVFLR